MQKATIDFASQDGRRQFAELVQRAHDKTILYLDWKMRNVARAGFIQRTDPDDNAAVIDGAICEHVERSASRPDGLVISGKPDPANNHLLFEITLDVVRGGPFARARCEYVEGANVLRLRGFFYVTNIGTATAINLEFKPLPVPAHRVPPEFLDHLR